MNQDQVVPAGGVPGDIAPVLTYGERAVCLTFNPSGDETVLKLKKLYVEIIDICAAICSQEPTYGSEGDPEMRVLSERGQLLKEAIRQAQTAQMWAVKGVTYKN